MTLSAAPLPPSATSSSSLSKNGTNQAFFGKEKPTAVRMSNIQAAKAVSDVIRTSLGPRGMDKMIRTAGGETIVTNDGATILKHMAVLHPCSRMLVELAEAQDVQAGDGTTSVVVIAGSLLAAAERLLRLGVHASLLSDAFRSAAAHATAVLEQMSTPVSLSDRPALMHLAGTSLSSKVVAPYGTLVAGIAVDSVLRVIDPKSPKQVDLSSVRVLPRLGGTIEDCELVDGLLLTQSRVASGTPSRIEKARIAVIQFHLSPPKTDMEGSIIINDYQQMDRVLQEERAHILNICKRIKKSGVNVILVQKSILRDATSDLALQFLAKMKVAVVTDIERDEVEFICTTLNCRPCADLDSLVEERLASADLFQEVHKDGSASFIHISGIRNQGRTASVLVRGANSVVLEEAARSLHDALCVVRCLAKRGATVPGGGAPEVEIATRLAKIASTLPSGAEALATAAFGDAMLAIPAILAENAGLNPVQVVTELRSCHAAGEVHFGINVRKGCVGDMRPENVIQPLLVSTSAIELATETVSMILKIDDIVACR